MEVDDTSGSGDGSGGDIWMCHCSPGFTGTLCEIKLTFSPTLNPTVPPSYAPTLTSCESAPCLNGGICIEDAMDIDDISGQSVPSIISWSCQCPNMFTGILCEERVTTVSPSQTPTSVPTTIPYAEPSMTPTPAPISPCNPNPCQHNGLCFEVSDGSRESNDFIANEWECLCRNGFGGDACEIDFSNSPSNTPTVKPTYTPSAVPTYTPSTTPTSSPRTSFPTMQPSRAPSATPSMAPTCPESEPEWCASASPFCTTSLQIAQLCVVTCGNCDDSENNTTMSTSFTTTTFTDSSAEPTFTTSHTTSATVSIQDCVDSVANWRDTEGDTCSLYYSKAYCNPDGTIGNGWDPAWGDLNDWAANGQSADIVCCQCGGGIQGTTLPTPTPSTNPSYAPTSVPTMSSPTTTPTLSPSSSAPSMSPTMSPSTRRKVPTTSTSDPVIYTLPSGNCVSHLWADKYNAGCFQYESEGWCNATGYGPSWDPAWGSFADYSNNNGISANQACCECGGGALVVDVNSTAVPTTTARSPWACIAEDCMDIADAVPVCDKNMQFMNWCWAKCFGVFDTKPCDYRLENAIDFNFTFDDDDVEVTEEDVSEFIANLSSSGCCTPEVSFYRKTAGLPSLWLSNAECDAQEHLVEVPCGRAKSGMVTRVCADDGNWLQEDASNCVDYGISQLLDNIDEIHTDNAVDVLSQLNALVGVDTLSLGTSDVSAILLILDKVLDVDPSFDTISSRIIVELVANVMDVNINIITKVLVLHDVDLHFQNQLERALRKYWSLAYDSFDLQSSNGNLIIHSGLYRTTESDYIEIVLEEGGGQVPGLRQRSLRDDIAALVRIPTAPYIDNGLNVASIYVVYYNNSRFFLDFLRTSGRPNSAVSVVLENWPEETHFDGEISYQLHAPLADVNAVCGDWTNIKGWNPDACYRNMSETTAFACICSTDGTSSYGVMPSYSISLPDDFEWDPIASVDHDPPVVVQILLGLSIVFLILVICSFVFFHELRFAQRRFYVINLSLALAASHTALAFGWSGSPESCKTWTGVSQFFALASMCWILVNLRVLYFALKLRPIILSTVSKLVHLFCGWGFPLIGVIVASWINLSEHTQNNVHCVVSEDEFWIGWAPGAVIIILVSAGYIFRLGFSGIRHANAFPLDDTFDQPLSGPVTLALLLLTTITWTLRERHQILNDFDIVSIVVALLAFTQSASIFYHNFFLSDDGKTLVSRLLRKSKSFKSKLEGTGSFWMVDPPVDYDTEYAPEVLEQTSPNWDPYFEVGEVIPNSQVSSSPEFLSKEMGQSPIDYNVSPDSNSTDSSISSFTFDIDGEVVGQASFNHEKNVIEVPNGEDKTVVDAAAILYIEEDKARDTCENGVISRENATEA